MFLLCIGSFELLSTSSRDNDITGYKTIDIQLLPSCTTKTVSEINPVVYKHDSPLHAGGMESVKMSTVDTKITNYTSCILNIHRYGAS